VPPAQADGFFHRRVQPDQFLLRSVVAGDFNLRWIFVVVVVVVVVVEE
jgi:hypothetical protein